MPMDILKILEELQDQAVMKPKTVIGKLTYGLNRDEVNTLILRVKAALPQELKEAASTVRESDRIMETAREDASLTLDYAKKEVDRITSEAKDEAERIIQQAKLEQEQMITSSEVLKLSKAQADEIITRAERDALDTRRGADEYAFRIIDHLGRVVQKTLSSIEDAKQAVDPTREIANPRERVKS